PRWTERFCMNRSVVLRLTFNHVIFNSFPVHRSNLNRCFSAHRKLRKMASAGTLPGHRGLRRLGAILVSHDPVSTELRIDGDGRRRPRAVVKGVNLISSELRARLLENGARSASDESHDPFPVVRLHTP